MLSWGWRHWFPGHRSDLTALYLTESLRNFGFALVGIFIPIYIFQLTGNFYYLPLYYLIFSGVAVLSLLPVSSLLPRVGIARSVFFSNLLRIAAFALLLAAPLAHPLILLAAVMEGFLIPTYWIPYHFIYTKEGRVGFYGREIGLMDLFGQSVRALAPLLGGLVILFFDFPALYLLAIIVVLLSSLPLSLAGDHLSFTEFSWKRVLSGLFSRPWRLFLIGYSGLGAEFAITGIFWPLFLFGIAGSFATLGGLASAPIVTGVVATVVAASYIDRVGFRRALSLGVVLWALAWIVAGFLSGIVAIFLLVLFFGIIGPFFWIAPDAITYTLAKKDPLDFILKRELSLHGFGFLVAGLSALLWYFFPENWPILFLPAVLGSFLTGALIFAKLEGR